MEKIELSRPIYRDSDLWKYKKIDRRYRSFNAITQLFGENAVSFYKTLGMKGHNGVDFRCQDGEPIYASHSGKVTKIYDKNNSNKTKGFGVYITHKDGYTTVYWHLLDCAVKLGDEVKDGQLIGHADNSGLYTTGTHLHWGLYPKNRDYNNGYHGAIDPLKFIINNKQMKLVIDKNDDQYLVEETCKFGVSIADPDILSEIVGHFAKLGITLESPELTDMTPYFIIHGAPAKKIKEFFNIQS